MEPTQSLHEITIWKVQTGTILWKLKGRSMKNIVERFKVIGRTWVSYKNFKRGIILQKEDGATVPFVLTSSDFKGA